MMESSRTLKHSVTITLRTLGAKFWDNSTVESIFGQRGFFKAAFRSAAKLNALQGT